VMSRYSSDSLENMEVDSLDGHVSANDDGFCDDGCNLEAIKLTAKFDKNAASPLNPKLPMFSRVKGMENGETSGFVYLSISLQSTIRAMNSPSLPEFFTFRLKITAASSRVARRSATRRLIKVNIDERRNARGMSFANVIHRPYILKRARLVQSEQSAN